jgi:hypothetical protein
MPHRCFPGILLLALLGASCNGPAAAGRDLLDPFRVVVGVGSGAGVRVNALGLVHTGLLFGVKPDRTSLGWKYGEALALQPAADGSLRAEVDQAVVVRTTSIFDLNYDRGGYALARTSFFLFPAVFSHVDSADPDGVEWLVPEDGVDLVGERWIWSREAFRDQRFAQIHAFDIEAEIMLAGYIEIGFSPGELLDFFFSLVGLDLAKDDHR